jgi:hypothetical protein
MRTFVFALALSLGTASVCAFAAGSEEDHSFHGVGNFTLPGGSHAAVARDSATQLPVVWRLGHQKSVV